MKKSFLLHIDSLCILEDLNDEQKGQLFYAMYQYQLGNEIELSPIIKIAFSQFKNQFERDNEKYKNTCEARKQAGSKGGKQKAANANKSKQKVANLADNENKNKNKNKSDNDSDKDNIDNMLENEFQACWKDYTLTFLKYQNRSGGTKAKAFINYKKLRKKYSHEDILNLIANHKTLKIGHKDLERLLREDIIKQFLEDGNISTSIVPKEWIGRNFNYNDCKCTFTERGYYNNTKDYEITNTDDVKRIIEELSA